MIFVTVGYQMAFDRLVDAVDQWAAEHPDAEMFAQIGPSELRPKNMPFTAFMEPVEFTRRVEACSVLVAHAGMGSILTALQFGKPILVMPRHAARGETRNDHQIATSRRLGERPGIDVAMDETEIADKLDRLASLEAPPKISNVASPELIARLRGFVAGTD
ncbi:MAG: glycosyltransferase [Phycisphaerales bacterium]|nr:glycosyltransferase [Phycisphaerales bacterium]